MSKTKRIREMPVRHGNAFPWLGILTGVKRMMLYAFFFVCLVVVLVGVLVLVGSVLVDNEPVGDYF